MNGKATILVISPLVSITKDQILNMKSIGYSASFPKTRLFWNYHRFPKYATFENKIPAETFPKFPSIIHVIDRSDRNSPITVRLA